MTRGTANTLRVLGTIVTVLVTLAASGLLLLISLLSGITDSRRKPEAVAFFMGGVLVLALGIWLVVWLVRGTRRSKGQAVSNAPGVSAPQPSLADPVIVSREGRMAIDLVVFVLGASLTWSFVALFVNQRALPFSPGHEVQIKFLLVQIAALILYNLPYAILLYGFLTGPLRWTFVYTVAVPAALTLMTLYSAATQNTFYASHSRAALFLVISLGIEIAILVLAWRAMRPNGIQPDPPSLLVAALAAFIYFVILRTGTPFLYRIFGR
ncbi:MAG TPA: hypothetical protein VNW97_06520 [Candidatus Saccharimonadales bacterium]|jgi:hypothetical protein|nr:hypothetical protein [Candidatus Saccharimonadales bacterium]